MSNTQQAPKEIKPSEFFIQRIQKQATALAIAQENLIQDVNNLIAYVQGLESEVAKIKEEKKAKEEKK
jgi:hypothetical protein